jgi:Flp pilus assembly protein TadD
MAAHVLRRALELDPREPRCLSYLGLCMATVNRRSSEALSLCEGALVAGCYDAILYCNLGKVYLLRGNRRKAYAAFSSGLKADPRNRDILSELRAMGIRQRAFFFSLPRGHAVNRFAGRMRRLLRRP